MMSVIPLSKMKPDDRGIVVNNQACPRLRGKLYSIGIAPGIIVQVIEKYSRGPIIIEVNGTRVAIGRNMSTKILVRPVP